MHNIRQSRHNLQTTTNTNTIIIPNNIKKNNKACGYKHYKADKRIIQLLSIKAELYK